MKTFKIEGPQQGRSSCLDAQQQREAWEEALKLLKEAQKHIYFLYHGTCLPTYRDFQNRLHNFNEKHHE